MKILTKRTALVDTQGEAQKGHGPHSPLDEATYVPYNNSELSDNANDTELLKTL